MQPTQSLEVEVPSPDVVALFVRLSRQIAGWKKATLAHVAKVSLSTIERVERGEAVGDESLERIAVALHQRPDAFTAPRVKLSDAEAIAALDDKWRWMEDVVPVNVAPLRKQAQLRELSAAVVCMLDHDLDADSQNDMVDLREWLGLTSFVRAEHEGLLGGDYNREHKLRRLYDDVLAFVHDLERRRRCVCLVGTYQPSTRATDFKDVSVGIVAVKSKDLDPAVAKRTTLYASTKVDLADALRRAWDSEDDEG